MFEDVEHTFARVAPEVDFWSLRVVHVSEESLTVRRNVVEPPAWREDLGAMVTLWDGSGMGYAATPDLSERGLRDAVDLARDWARRSAGRMIIDPPRPRAPRTGEYRSAARVPWEGVGVAERIALLRRECERLECDARIVDWSAGLCHSRTTSLYLTSAGDRLWQRLEQVLPSLRATARDAGHSQTRTFGGHARARQGGFEVLEALGFFAAAPRVGAEAAALLDAPNCPSGMMDLVLAPDQMVLQIHESIGHPLELDRILGDERNYAGTSFVTPEMFGHYRYGSPLLNVTFDPEVPGEFASYAYDDEGEAAQRAYLIRDGVLLRGLGGATSQARSGLPGVASARASGWSRPPIDRMANLNLEPGEATLAQLIGRVERGVYMETNRSWSIDDSRNKFQFGCEWGRLIEDGRLTTVVKNPGYRGISAEFWRNLKGVGDGESREVLGVPNCGKGEPNQGIRVGHAAPPCLFAEVAVFGGL